MNKMMLNSVFVVLCHLGGNACVGRFPAHIFQKKQIDKIRGRGVLPPDYR